MRRDRDGPVLRGGPVLQRKTSRLLYAPHKSSRHAHAVATPTLAGIIEAQPKSTTRASQPASLGAGGWLSRLNPPPYHTQSVILGGVGLAKTTVKVSFS